jgi:hypothetical protein
LYLKFTGGSSPLVSFDWWKFEQKAKQRAVSSSE